MAKRLNYCSENNIGDSNETRQRDLEEYLSHGIINLRVVLLKDVHYLVRA